MLDLGNVQSGSTLPLYIPFNTSNKTGSAAGFASDLVVGDFSIFKNGSTERGSTAGYSIVNSGSLTATGSYVFGVDVNNNTTAGFFDEGHFSVLLAPGTGKLLDGENVEKFIARFSIVGDPTVSRISGSILAASSSVSLVYTDTTAILADTSVIGTPTSSIADDLAAVSSSVVSILADTDVIGSPAGASIAADIAQIDTVVDGIQTDLDNGTDGLGALKSSITIAAESASFASQSAASADVKLGTPTGASVSADIATVDTNVDTIVADYARRTGDYATSASLDNVYTELTTDVSAVKSDTGNILTDTANIDTKINTVEADYARRTGDYATSASVSVVYTDTIAILTDTANIDTKINTVEADYARRTGDYATSSSLDNVYTELVADIATVDTVVDGIQTDLDNGTDGLGAIKTAVDTVLTTALTEAYGTDGSDLTAAQLLYMVYGLLGEFSVSGTTVTVKQLDGSSTAATFTLFPDGTTPTSMSRTG